MLIKTGENALFVVTTQSQNGAEVYEIIDIYLLGKFLNIIGKKNIGLYRVDRFPIIENANGPKRDRLRKDVIVILHNEGLKVTTDTNLPQIIY